MVLENNGVHLSQVAASAADQFVPQHCDIQKQVSESADFCGIWNPRQPKKRE